MIKDISVRILSIVRTYKHDMQVYECMFALVSYVVCRHACSACMHLLRTYSGYGKVH